MNAADLAAARRLIAQFTGEAPGRHNSSQEMRARPGQVDDDEPWCTAEYRRALFLQLWRPALASLTNRMAPPKERPEDCEVGDWVEYIPGIPPSHLGRVRVPIPPLRPRRFEDYRRDETIRIFQFDPFCRWRGENEIERTGWRRVA